MGISSEPYQFFDLGFSNPSLSLNFTTPTVLDVLDPSSKSARATHKDSFVQNHQHGLYLPIPGEHLTPAVEVCRLGDLH